jgi:hypothetical protein
MSDSGLTWGRSLGNLGCFHGRGDSSFLGLASALAVPRINSPANGVLAPPVPVLPHTIPQTRLHRRHADYKGSSAVIEQLLALQATMVADSIVEPRELRV